MPIIPDYAQPKGNQNMTLFGERNDDTTVTLPELPFSFMYNSVSCKTLFSSGNTWVGFGSGTEHLQINRRDASYNKLFYAVEKENGMQTFRVRFEGNSVYSSWGANDLLWEFTVFSDGVCMLVIERSPRNGTDSFANPTVGTTPCTFETGKSYVFLSESKDGTNYTITEGSYLPYVTKYLAEDDDGIKAFDEESGMWTVLEASVLTEELFLTYGTNALPSILDGLLDASTLHCYTDSTDILSEIESYKMHIYEIVTSKPKTIIQTEDFNISTEREISSIEFRYSVTGGSIAIAFSIDGGASWLTYKDGAFLPIDIFDEAIFLENGLTPQAFMNINMAEFNQLIDDKVRFAYILQKPNLTDICKLKAVKITYAE